LKYAAITWALMPAKTVITIWRVISKGASIL